MASSNPPAAVDCSVIIPSYNSAGTIVSCLDSVLRQDTEFIYEVLVADSSDDETPSIIAREYPDVILIRFGKKTDPGTARNEAVGRAMGEILLFTDSDCIVNGDWVESMVQAHKNSSSFRVYGGAVLNGNPETVSSKAGYLVEFSEYLPTVPEGVVRSLPTCNISYHRTIFSHFGGFRGEYYPQEDYLFNWSLTEKGEKIRFCPHIQVKHFHRDTFTSYLRHNYRFGIVTAHVLKVTDLPGSFFARRPMLALFFIPLLPFVKFFRTVKRVIRFSPSLTPNIIALPAVLVGLFVWGFGFARGVFEKDVSKV